MDLDIEFGELEEARPETQLRPDANKHYAVVPVFEPDERDLPVFIDIDAMRDMEVHALSDTNVELGGVMLGGQYQDEDERPFVVVTDSLRAQHFEATKGSFKFTHDTWAEITRQRDEFPDELQMVGWYHTHPDWGVFLSGMDMFICDNFFNKALDVALVIDPCRQDRGFFQWTGDESDRVRRTSGFYLIASRFRQDELDDFAALLEGSFMMANDPRFRGSNQNAPVVNIAGQQSGWQNAAVMGMLTIQFCFLLLFASRFLLPQEEPKQVGDKQIAALQTSIDRLAEAQQKEAEVGAKIQVLDRFINNWAGTPDKLVSELAETAAENEQLQGSVRGQQVLVADLDQRVGALTKQLANAESNKAYLNNRIKSLQADISSLRSRNSELSGKVLKTKSKNKDDEESDDSWGLQWTWIGVGAAIVVLVLGGAAAAVLKKKEDFEYEESAEERDSDTNS